MGGGSIRAVAEAGVVAFSGGDNPVAAAISQATRSTVAVDSSSNLEEAMMVTGFAEPIQPLPRVVFHAAPTVEEAEDALSELTTVIERDYLSPNAPGLAGSSVSFHKPDLALPSSESVETITCVGNEASITPAAPIHAIQAFRLLHESPAARTFVASIASDHNVWNAVLQNDEVVKFLEAYRTVAYPEMKQSVIIEELADDDKSRNSLSPRSSEKSCDSKESGPGNRFMRYVWNIKERITTSIAQRTGVAYPEMKQSVTVEELADDDKGSNHPQSPMSSEKSCDSKESGPGKRFMRYVWDTKERVTTFVAHRIGVSYPEMKPSVTVEELAHDDESRNHPQSPMSSERSSDSKESGPGKRFFMHYVGDIKEKITIQNLYGGAVKGDSFAHCYEIPETTIVRSILPVVVMVIMVVVFKRI